MNIRTRWLAGFTLVELLVVVAIIGILVAVVAVGSGEARKQSRDAKRKADIESIAGALELYRLTNHEYPQAVPFNAESWGILRTALVPQFLGQLPEDPLGGSESGGSFASGYVYSSNGSKFVLDTRLEAEKNTTLGELEFSQNDRTSPLFYVSGIYKASNNTLHYRVSSTP